MTTMYIVRHAEAEGNLYRRCHGHYDSRITSNGYRQIAALEQRFSQIPVDAVYSSDLFRTKTTARAIFLPKHLMLQTTPRLREVGTGIWEDHTWGELEYREPDAMARFNRCQEDWQVEGGETFSGVQKRMTEELLTIAAAHPNQTVAVVSHGTAIRLALAAFTGLTVQEIPYCDNTAVSKLEITDGEVKVLYRGDNCHLPEEISTFARQAWWREQSDGTVDPHLRFRPLDFQTEEGFYRECRQEAWRTIHHTMAGFDGDQFTRDAQAQSAFDPQSVLVAMNGTAAAGLLQMDFRKDAAEKRGGIPFFYMLPDYRCRGMGVQLLGQAVSTYRNMGRTHLRLRCAPDNTSAQRFYQRNGFAKSGEDHSGPVVLDLMDKEI